MITRSQYIARFTMNRVLQCPQHGVEPFIPFVASRRYPLVKAGVLCTSLVPGTSMLGFLLKKLLGLKTMLRCSTGILRSQNQRRRWRM